MSFESDATHRLSPIATENACHRIVTYVDAMRLSEAEKLAALLAAAYSQRRFMLESELFADDVSPVEQFHKETIEQLAGAPKS